MTIERFPRTRRHQFTPGSNAGGVTHFEPRRRFGSFLAQRTAHRDDDKNGARVIGRRKVSLGVGSKDCGTPGDDKPVPLKRP